MVDKKNRSIRAEESVPDTVAFFRVESAGRCAVTGSNGAKRAQLMNDDDRRVVLLVTQDYQTMDVLEQTFARANYRVVEAMNLEQAVAASGQQVPDIAVIDSEVREVSREALNGRMPENMELRSMPIVHLYPSSGAAHEQGKCLDLDQYLGKPFDPIVLATLVERTLTNRQALIDSTDSMAMVKQRDLSKEVLRELHRVERNGGSMSLCIFELVEGSRDQILHGGVPAPAVFDRVAGLLPGMVRASSLLRRLGLRRFIWVMPETNIKGGRQAVGRLMEALAELPIAEIRTPLRIQAGLASAPADGMDFEELVQTAEQEMVNNPVGSGRDDFR